MSDLEVKIFNNLGVCPTGSGIFIIPGATGPQGPTGATGPAGATGMAAPSSVGLVRITKYSVGSGSGRLLHPNTTAFIAEGCGPGGGAGGVDGATTTGHIIASCGAASGGYFKHIFYRDESDVFDYLVGTGGAGGAAGAHDGEYGSDYTSLTYGGFTVGGGYGTSSGGAAYDSSLSGFVVYGANAAPNLGPPNLISINGELGGNAYIGTYSTLSFSGRGGKSFMGSFTDSVYVTGTGSSDGFDGDLGCGGIGAIVSSINSPRSGGRGGDGWLIVYEYCGLFAP